VRSYLASEDAARFQLMSQSNEVIEKILKAGVEADVVKEVPTEAVEAEVME